MLLEVTCGGGGGGGGGEDKETCAGEHRLSEQKNKNDMEKRDFIRCLRLFLRFSLRTTSCHFCSTLIAFHAYLPTCLHHCLHSALPA